MDKANATIMMCYQTTEPAAVEKRPRPENSDIQSDVDDHEVRRRRKTPKPRYIHSPRFSPKIGINKRNRLKTGPK